MKRPTISTAASTTGKRAHASTTGDLAHASTTGDLAHASTTGIQARASTTGKRAHTSTTGDLAHASTTGYQAHASTTGYRANASTTGYEAHASTTGDEAHATASAGSAQTTGNHSVAIGRQVRLTNNGMNAVVLPGPGWQPFIVSVSDGWPEWQWISMDDIGNVTADPHLLLPNDGRGYELKFINGRYVAGCRSFEYEEAVAHWSNPDHQAPVSARLLLGEVEHHHNRIEGQPDRGIMKRLIISAAAAALAVLAVLAVLVAAPATGRALPDDIPDDAMTLTFVMPQTVDEDPNTVPFEDLFPQFEGWTSCGWNQIDHLFADAFDHILHPSDPDSPGGVKLIPGELAGHLAGWEIVLDTSGCTPTTTTTTETTTTWPATTSTSSTTPVTTGVSPTSSTSTTSAPATTATSSSTTSTSTPTTSLPPSSTTSTSEVGTTVTPPTSARPTTIPSDYPPTPPSTDRTSPSGSGTPFEPPADLPATGAANARPMVAVGVFLAGFGVVAVVVSRRRP